MLAIQIYPVADSLFFLHNMEADYRHVVIVLYFATKSGIAERRQTKGDHTNFVVFLH
jgi:hypothetical protein